MYEWTREKPMKIGWYWSRTDKTHERIVHVRRVNGRLYCHNYNFIDAMTGEWAGPIPEPTERTEV